MAIRRYAFLYRPPEGGREEYGTAGENLTAEEAVERFHERHPDGEIIKPLRGDVPDDLDLSRSEAEFVTENDDDLEDEVAELEESISHEDLVEELEEADDEDDGDE